MPRGASSLATVRMNCPLSARSVTAIEESDRLLRGRKQPATSNDSLRPQPVSYLDSFDVQLAVIGNAVSMPENAALIG